MRISLNFPDFNAMNIKLERDIALWMSILKEADTEENKDFIYELMVTCIAKKYKDLIYVEKHEAIAETFRKALLRKL